MNSSQMTPPARPLLPTSPPLPSLRTGKRIMRPSPAGQGGISPQPRACQPFDYLCHHRVPAPLSPARAAGSRARVPGTPKRLQFWANGARLPAPRAARRGRGPRLGLGLRFGSLPGGCRRPMPVTQGGPASTASCSEIDRFIQERKVVVINKGSYNFWRLYCPYKHVPDRTFLHLQLKLQVCF